MATTEERAIEIAAARAKMYFLKRCNHASIRVFTKSITEVDLLRRVFGGEYYKHRSGYYWTLGKRDDQIAFANLVISALPRDHELRKGINRLLALRPRTQ